MSRFLEGSMNDRASVAPPGMFVGWEDRQNCRSREPVTAAAAAPALTLFPRRSMQAVRPTFPSQDSGASTATESTTSTAPPALKRPRSFLAPLWDGVTKHLHWRRNNGEQEDEKSQQQQQQQQPMTPFTFQGQQPTNDEILANYHQLMADGFFSKRAIPATRQGLSRNQPPPTQAERPPMPTRGMKRVHTDDEEDNHVEAHFTPAATPSHEGEGRRSLRARGQQPRKLRKPSVNRLRSEQPLQEQHQDNNSNDRPLPNLPLSAPRPVAVHQAPPRASQRLAQKVAAATAAAATAAPAPAPVPTLVPAASGRRTLSKKRKSSTSFGHSGRSREQIRRVIDNHHADDDDDDAGDDGKDGHTPKKKRTATMQAFVAPPVVVHHVHHVQQQQQQQHQQYEQHQQEWRLEQVLRPRPSPSPAGPTAATAVDPALRPISFHYPQRVRVRRPLQETTTTTATTTATTTPGVRLRAQGPRHRAKQGVSSRAERDSLEPLPKPRTAAMVEDEENVMPLW